jgi:hypothetical protein
VAGVQLPDALGNDVYEQRRASNFFGGFIDEVTDHGSSKIAFSREKGSGESMGRASLSITAFSVADGCSP